MNNQEFERKMNLIVEQHAQFAADMEMRRGFEQKVEKMPRARPVEFRACR